MKKTKRNLATILAGTYLTAAALVIGMIDVKLAKENKISLENVSKNYFKSICNLPYTAVRSFFGLTGKDILTGRDVAPILGGYFCAMQGMADQIFYNVGIFIPYKTKDVGEKRQFDEGVIDIPTSETEAQSS